MTGRIIFIIICVINLRFLVASHLERGCSDNVASPSCLLELSPHLRHMAANATLISSDLTKMTVLNFIQLITDGELRQILLKALHTSIQFAADFSLNSLERDQTGLRRTILVGLLNLSEQFIDITKHFMQNESIAKRMTTILDRLRNMSSSGENIVKMLGQRSLRNFTAFRAINTGITLMQRCFDPERLRDGCVILLDTKKFVITNVKRVVDR